MARPKYPSDKQDQFMLRLPHGMREVLKEIAADNGRSMNAEIVDRLTASLQWPELSISPDLHAEVIHLPVGILSELEEKMRRDMEIYVSEAIYNHKLSQGNLVSQLEMLVEFAPEEEQPRLRDQIRDLFIRAGISPENSGYFSKDDE